MDFCLHSQHGWVSCNLLVICSYLTCLARLGRGLLPPPHPDGWACLSPPTLFQQNGAARLMSVISVRAVTQFSIPSWALFCTTGHNKSTDQTEKWRAMWAHCWMMQETKDRDESDMLNASFALVCCWRSLSGLLTTCACCHCLVWWGTAQGRRRANYELVL